VVASHQFGYDYHSRFFNYFRLTGIEIDTVLESGNFCSSFEFERITTADLGFFNLPSLF